MALGPTNLDATIRISITARKKKPGKKVMFPVESEEIQSAVSSLRGVPILEKKPNKNPSETPRMKSSIPQRRKLPTEPKRQELLPLQRVFDAKPDFYSSEELRQRHQEMSSRIVEQAKLKALRRASQFEQEKRLEQERMQQEEQRRVEETKALYAKKAEELQLRTALRVKRLKQERFLRQKEDQEKQQRELLARQEREALARAKDQEEKIRNLRKETEER